MGLFLLQCKCLRLQILFQILQREACKPGNLRQSEVTVRKTLVN